MSQPLKEPSSPLPPAAAAAALGPEEFEMEQGVGEPELEQREVPAAEPVEEAAAPLEEEPFATAEQEGLGGESAAQGAEEVEGGAAEFEERVAAARRRGAEQIERFAGPAPLRDRLRALLPETTCRGEQLLVPWEAALGLLRSVLPEALLLDPAGLPRAEHPAGEGYFSGDPADLSEEEARRIAAEQLAGSGFERR